MALSLLAALAVLLATASAQQPETKELFVSRGHINLVNNVLHGTVRKILFPFANKIPRTISKRTHIHTSFPSYSGGVPSQTPSGTRTLDETLAADVRFTTLVAALSVAFPDSSNVLNGTSPLTIFAPTNSAFNKLGNDTLDTVLKDPARLSTILQRHLVANKAVRIPDGSSSEGNLAGGTLSFSRTIDDIFSEGVTVSSSQGQAKITQLDIQASDGVIHAIDTVI